MSESILAVLNYALLALIYWFFWRVLRAVWTEVTGPQVGALARARGADGGSVDERPAGTRHRGVGGRSIPTRIVVLEPPERKGTAYPIAGDVIIGRAPTCSIQLPNDTFASSMHTRIWVDSGDVWVEDLGSTNGTMVNSNRLVSAMRLSDGDRIVIGETVFEARR